MNIHFLPWYTDEIEQRSPLYPTAQEVTTKKLLSSYDSKAPLFAQILLVHSLSTGSRLRSLFKKTTQRDGSSRQRVSCDVLWPQAASALLPQRPRVRVYTCKAVLNCVQHSHHRNAQLMYRRAGQRKKSGHTAPGHGRTVTKTRSPRSSGQESDKETQCPTDSFVKYTRY